MTTPLGERDVLDVVGAYKLSAAVIAMADLGIADALADGARTTAELARDLALHEPVLDRLLRMLASRGVLTSGGEGAWLNTEFSAALTSGGLRDMVLGWPGLPSIFTSWATLAESARAGTSPFVLAHGSGMHDYLDSHPDEAALYGTAMGSTIDGFLAIAEALDLSHVSTVVSVGGGSGVELVPLLEKWPDVRGVLADLPGALEGAAEVLAAHSVADRVTIVPGDARQSVPSGDAYVLSTVLRCLADDDVVAVLRSCRTAASSGATVHVVEMPLPEGAPTHPMSTADVTAWVAYGGADRTVPQWRDLFERAGWALTATVPLEEPFVMLTGTVIPS